MSFFDTHAHLNDRAFDADRDALIPSLFESGMALCIEVSCATDDFSRGVALTHAYPQIYGAYGIHPEFAKAPGDSWEKALREALGDEKAVALGEIGLDYHYTTDDKAEQRALFDRQLELARELKKPVILHIRESFGDTMDILRAHRAGLSGVMHCFSGSAETARECVGMGLYIAFGGAVTFKNAAKLLDAARAVPLERLLVETDCPYLSPEPKRGKRNDPSNVPYIIERLAAVRGESPELVARATLENGKTLFGIA